MFDRSKLEPDAKAYFETLPSLLQENLIQTGVDLRTKAELEQYCDSILSKH